MKIGAKPARKAPARTTVNFGPKTLQAANEVRIDLGLESVSDVARFGITVVTALSNAEKRGFQIQIVTRNKRVYRYTLLHPKFMTALSALPTQKPETVWLLESAPDPKAPDLVAPKSEASGDKVVAFKKRAPNKKSPAPAGKNLAPTI